LSEGIVLPTKCPYLIIKTGYEGIEELCYLTADKDEVKQKFEELVLKEVEEYEELKKLAKQEGFTLSSKSEQEIRDFFCVQKWNGREFKCACGDFDLAPSKLMLR